jgi:hypothetical protein
MSRQLIRRVLSFQQKLRQGRHFFSRWAKNPDLVRFHAAFQEAESRLDWNAARSNALLAASTAEQTGDVKLMEEMGKVLGPLGEYARSAELRLKSRQATDPMRIAEWRGEDISTKTLLIDLMETEKQGLAVAIRAASLVAQAVRRAKAAILVVESRLVPLLRRTFPSAETVAFAEREAVYRRADVCASVQHLTTLFAADPVQLKNSFFPVVADATAASEMRVQYKAESNLPLVGLSWTSAAVRKESPELSHWNPILENDRLKLVSIQYGKIEDDLDKLRSRSRNGLTFDSAVDQLKDMDRFASQLAALDAVVTVSNTGAHLAGALGIPTVIIVEDKIRNWPVFENTTPFYPSVTIVRREGRDWPATVADAHRRLLAILERLPKRA